jgi:hypothetical protein
VLARDDDHEATHAGVHRLKRGEAGCGWAWVAREGRWVEEEGGM